MTSQEQSFDSAQIEDSEVQAAQAGRDVNQTRIEYNYRPYEADKGISPQKLPLGTSKFVGREPDVEKLHCLLQSRNGVVISAISGMGGIGKTELAIQYADQYQQDYPGGICWLSAKNDIQNQLLGFIQICEIVAIPKELTETSSQLAYGLQNWRAQGLVLLILDDISKYTKFKEFVQRLPPQFKVILTTRIKRLEPSFAEVCLDSLSEEKSLELIQLLLATLRTVLRGDSAVLA